VKQRKMRRVVLARVIGKLYPRLPAKRHVLKFVAALEGGDMTSVTLRELLRRHHGVTAGPYAYGSLLELGMADKGTTIGAYASIGPNVRRIGAAHPLDRLLLHPFWYNPTLGYVGAEHDVERTKCDIGADVWIGANATILPGCSRVGTGAVIGAGAVVTADVADFSVVAGVPARAIGRRLAKSQRDALLSIDDWNIDPDALAARLGIGEGP
jgi:virginiamycin A acetyltransferase